MKTSKITFLALPALALLASNADAGFYTSGPWSTSDMDGSTWEVYGDAVNDHPGTQSDLANCVPGVLAWAGRMSSAGYSYQVGTDIDAWSVDFEEAGLDDLYGDAADYAYISTHGGSDYVAFNGSVGDNALTSGETYWGELDMDVIAIDACNVLDANGRWSIFSNGLNDGTHFVLGFDSVSLDTASNADLYGYYLTQGYTHVSAWYSSTTASHPATYTFPNGGPTVNLVASFVQFYSPSCNTWNDTMNTVSCDPKYDSWGAYSTWGL